MFSITSWSRYKALDRRMLENKTKVHMSDKSKVPIRRGIGRSGWAVADNQRWAFFAAPNQAFMSDVVFVHEAAPMACVPGYDSTGEAVGCWHEKVRELQMPSDTVRTAEVVYDRERRVFHVKDKPDERVDSADYLLLRDNGTATVGWSGGRPVLRKFFWGW